MTDPPRDDEPPHDPADPFLDLMDGDDDLPGPTGSWLGTLGELGAALVVVAVVGVLVMGTLAVLTWIFR